MKRLITIIALILSISAFGQRTPIRFLGLPVDGTKTSMIKQLKQKGFQYNAEMGCLEGSFNGKSSLVFIHENKGKVDRIMVAGANMVGPSDIKWQFNQLLRDFEKNGKYLSSRLNKSIPDDEDINYEMTVHDKTYAAFFYPSLVELMIDEERDEGNGLVYYLEDEHV